MLKQALALGTSPNDSGVNDNWRMHVTVVSRRGWVGKIVAGLSVSLAFVRPVIGQIDTRLDVRIKNSLMLGESLPESVRKQLPIFVFGDVITGKVNDDVTLEGHAELRTFGTVIHADKLVYNQPSDVARATGNVLINRLGNRYWGPELELAISDFKGFFNQPSYQFLKNKANGSADRIDFVSERVSIAKNASFSTCQRPETADTLGGKPWQPDWIMRADKVTFNVDEDIATAEGAQLRFKDVPILALPGFSFPMSDKRKSGFLPLSLAQDSISGWEYTQPYYWNIAPNRDLTLYPSYIAKRGLNQGAEFRYLEPSFTGQLRADYLSNDALYGDKRWGVSSDTRAQLSSPLGSLGGTDMGLRLQLNRVSDNSFWRDFPRASGSLTQRLLNNELHIASQNEGWTSLARVQRWQTLQDTTNPITPPFDRAQINTKKNFFLERGVQAQLDLDFTGFTSNSALTGQPDGRRTVAALQLSRPWLHPSGFITPKLQLHATAYQLDANASTQSGTKQRFVPTFSLDSGLFFEKSSTLFGNAYNQTLEPRAFYVHSPYRNQANLPNYDSGAKDFSLSTVYSENPYVGNDRIADMNMLTLGLTTRFLNPQTGHEALRAGIAQRYRFSDQLVTLPGEAIQTERLSDWLLNTGINLDPRWALDGTVQFGAKSGVSERTTLTGRFNPSNYRSVYASYRMQKETSEQVDVGWQWPLADVVKDSHWYTVGRLNYSVRDQRLVSAIMGFEYDADCWVGRVAIEQTQLDLNTTNQRVMFQLEFVGFSRVGISPLASLRRNIPRYQNLREQTTTPSRFSQYD
jgi:LPS-assembly protein